MHVDDCIPYTKELCVEFRSLHAPHRPLLTEKLIQRLYPPHADILLPNLRSFRYYGLSTLHQNMHLFRDVLVYRFRQCALRAAEVGTVDSKQATVSQIQSVTVRTSSRLVISPDIQEELDCLVKEGLELSLTTLE